MSDNGIKCVSRLDWLGLLTVCNDYMDLGKEALKIRPRLFDATEPDTSEDCRTSQEEYGGRTREWSSPNELWGNAPFGCVSLNIE
jgi:hypothetical protein